MVFEAEWWPDHIPADEAAFLLTEASGKENGMAVIIRTICLQTHERDAAGFAMDHSHTSSQMLEEQLLSDTHLMVFCRSLQPSKASGKESGMAVIIRTICLQTHERDAAGFAMDLSHTSSQMLEEQLLSDTPLTVFCRSLQPSNQWRLSSSRTARAPKWRF